MEEILGQHVDVAECAVIGRQDDLKGQMPVGFVVLKSAVMTSEAEISKALIQLVRDLIGAVASFKEVYIVPSTIDDPDSLKEIESLVLTNQNHF